MNKRNALFGGLLLVSLVLWWPSLVRTFSYAIHNDQYTHILVILPVSLAFIFLERRKLQSVAKWSGWTLSYILFALSLTVFLVEKFTALVPASGELTLSMAALVVWWISSFIVCFGIDAFRIALFPLCFLYWIVPWPQPFLDLLIQMLQHYSASGVAWTFQLFGIPVLRDGVILSIPGLTIEVAKECSSIRSSLILLVSSMVLAQLFLRAKWRKGLIVLLAVPLSVGKNVLRIFTLSMLGIHVNRGFLTGRLHHQGGIVFYAAALAVIFLVIYLFQRQENRQANSPQSSAVLAVE
jgi:exosortase